MATLRFLLVTYGSRGDVHPMLALALALARRGHRAVLAGPPDFAVDALRWKVDYRPMGSSMAELLRRHHGALRGTRLGVIAAFKREAAAAVAAQYDVLAPLAREADRVVAASLVFAARSCAEQVGRPFRFLAFAPETFPSRFHPALGERRQALPEWGNRLSWWAARRIDNWLLRRPINHGRVAFGLRPVDDVLDHFAVPAESLLAADAELAPCAPDVGLAHAPTGAMLLADETPLPAELERFLAAGPAPAYVGFGSMGSSEVAPLGELIAAAVRQVGCRAVVSLGGTASELGRDIFVANQLPHGALFPRMAAAVHHGGAGTSARVARAGIPQVIVPHLLDQFPWAFRLNRRGLAPQPLLRSQLTARALAARLRDALASTSMHTAATAVAERLAGRDGADTAAALLERD